MALSPRAARCRRKFLKFFPDGFRDETYHDWERDYKWATHTRWASVLGKAEFARLLKAGEYATIAARAVRVEQQSRHSMVFSFEKMALRDAIRPSAGSRAFACGLFDFLHGRGRSEDRFAAWVDVVAALPRKQTRVLTWPVVSVFGFIAKPRVHIFLKPTVTRVAAEAYGFDLAYAPRPNWSSYRSLLAFARQIREDVADLGPRDLIDIQSFIWVLGSSEYDVSARASTAPTARNP